MHRVLREQDRLRKRGSEQPHDWVREDDPLGSKPLKRARSQAEIIRVRQGWALIAIGCTNVALTVILLVTR